jgi:hypothetical protein
MRVWIWTERKPLTSFDHQANSTYSHFYASKEIARLTDFEFELRGLFQLVPNPFIHPPLIDEERRATTSP